MPARLIPKWIDTHDNLLGNILVADGIGGALVSSISIHDHTDLPLLETYTQTEVDLANAVNNTHSHSNKFLLDSYTQTELDLANAVTLKHTANTDIGTTQTSFIINSLASNPISLVANNRLEVYDITNNDFANIKMRGCIIAGYLVHVGTGIGFFNTDPVVKTAVTLTNTDTAISALTFNQTTYTVSEIEALRDKCEELADDVRAMHTALSSYGLI